MKKELEFKYPFWQWGGLGFYNCYAAVYMYLQGATDDNVKCSAKEGKGCNNCSNCSEKLVNLFETMAGQTIARQSWSGEKTKIQKELDAEFGNGSNASDKLVDFIIGFTGYEYKKITDRYKENIIASVDAGRPVITKLSNDSYPTDLAKGYRIVTGYDGDALLGPDYKPAAEITKQPEYSEIECLYIFGEKIPQRYTFLDVLKFMERVMGSDFAEGIWYDYAQKFDYEGEKLWDVDVAEMKSRFKRLANATGWMTNMSHSLQNAFGDKQILKTFGMDAERLGELLNIIGSQTHLLHNLGYQENALRNSVNMFQMNDTDKWPWDIHGLITSASLVLDSIIECDLKILIAIKKAIRKLS